MAIPRLSEKRVTARLLSLIALTLTIACPPGWARPSPAEDTFGTLLGSWARPDGGYLIFIESVDADGKLDAMYANPNRLPFSKAEASRERGDVRLFLELVAGGHNGSTCTLAYDPGADTLRGIYYQTVARQSHEAESSRTK